MRSEDSRESADRVFELMGCWVEVLLYEKIALCPRRTRSSCRLNGGLLKWWFAEMADALRKSAHTLGCLARMNWVYYAVSALTLGFLVQLPGLLA